MTDVELGQDMIDSRDVIERIETLEAYLLQPGEDAVEGCQTGEDTLPAEANGLCEDHNAELGQWRDFADQGEAAADWLYGAGFILDSYFEDYARELAEDIGAIPSDYSWPSSHIDWKAAAEALQIDYFTVEVGGYTYWAR